MYSIVGVILAVSTLNKRTVTKTVSTMYRAGAMAEYSPVWYLDLIFFTIDPKFG